MIDGSGNIVQGYTLYELRWQKKEQITSFLSIVSVILILLSIASLILLRKNRKMVRISSLAIALVLLGFYIYWETGGTILDLLAKFMVPG
jgi:membrane-bound ClpP family serine protease